jgi:hypothetical protein
MISIARAGFGTAIDAAEVAADVATQAELDAVRDASGGAWREVLRGQGIYNVDDTAGTYIPSSTAVKESGNGGFQSASYPVFYFVAADYAITGMTTKMKLRSQTLCNATAAGTMTFITGLYPLNVAGGTDDMTWTVGTIVTGSTATATNPGASTVTSAVSSEFTIPSDGAYTFATVTNATIANNCRARSVMQLLINHVAA